MTITFDFSQSQAGITHTKQFYESLSLEYVTEADFSGPTTVRSVTVTENDQTDTFTIGPFGDHYPSDVSAYRPGAGFIYSVSENPSTPFGFKIPISSSGFPDIRSFVGSSYSSYAALDADRQRYFDAWDAWDNAMNQKVFHSAEFGGLNGASGVFTSTEPMTGLKATILRGGLMDGSDIIIGSNFADILHGEGSQDEIRGGAGNDTLDGGTARDVLFGGADVDTLYGRDGNDDLYGEDDGDFLYGENNDDRLAGGKGNDFLYGGDGFDILRGGWEDDQLFGEGGSDDIQGIYALADNPDGEYGTNEINGGVHGNLNEIDSVLYNSPMAAYVTFITMSRAGSDSFIATVSNDHGDVDTNKNWDNLKFSDQTLTEQSLYGRSAFTYGLWALNGAFNDISAWVGRLDAFEDQNGDPKFGRILKWFDYAEKATAALSNASLASGAKAQVQSIAVYVAREAGNPIIDEAADRIKELADFLPPIVRGTLYAEIDKGARKVKDQVMSATIDAIDAAWDGAGVPDDAEWTDIWQNFLVRIRSAQEQDPDRNLFRFFDQDRIDPASDEPPPTPAPIEIPLGTYEGTDNGEFLIAGDGPQTIYAKGGDDFVFAGAGDDIVLAGSGGGDDLYDGGAGYDTIRFLSTTAGVIVVLGDGLATGAEIGNDTLFGFEQVVGGSGSDSITGDDQDNTLSGFTGSDALDGRAGSDRVVLAGLNGAGHAIFSFGGIVYALDRGNRSFDTIQNCEEFSDLHQTIGIGQINVFDALTYGASYNDLAAVFRTGASNLTSHYLEHGFGERREVSFDSKQYAANYGDLTAAFGQDANAATQHFLTHGVNEHRLAENPFEYVASYADLTNAFKGLSFEEMKSTGLQHYQAFGFAEGRRGGIDFDAKQYLANYADLHNAFGSDENLAAFHFVKFGQEESRLSEDPLEYVASYGDLINVFGSATVEDMRWAALTHFREYGRVEGRQNGIDFDADQYLSNYDDLRAAFADGQGGYNEHAAMLHFIQYGFAEGRTDSILFA